MKRIFLVLLIFMIFLIPFNNTFAADQQNSSVSYIEGPSFILYYGTVSMATAAAEDNHYTKAMYIAGCNTSYAYMRIFADDSTGTEDANGFLEYSNAEQSSGLILHATFSGTATNADLDGLTTTVVRDTCGVILGTRDDFQNSMWMRIKLDGQTSNPQSTWNWWIWVHKDETTPVEGVAGVKSTS